MFLHKPFAGGELITFLRHSALAAAIFTGPRLRIALSTALLLIVSGCAGLSQTPEIRPTASCESYVQAIEVLAARRAITLSAPRAVPGYPLLGTNRVLASFGQEALTPAQREDWYRRLEDAGSERVTLLRQMLEDSASREPLPDWFVRGDPPDCASAQSQVYTAVGDTLALSGALAVGDDYITARRVLGLYPLTALGVSLGVQSLQDDIGAVFATPLAQLPVTGELRRYRPQRDASAVRIVPEVQDTVSQAWDTLGPRPQMLEPAQRDALFSQHAPVLEIDHSGAFDRPGEPYFAASGKPRVDSRTPLVYRYTSVMPFAGTLRLQLNYLFWFDERPASGPLDSLAGPLDGVLWRVTLDEHGEVLLYDSIHACGCYHQFFPGAQLALRDATRDWPEPPLIPQAAPVTERDNTIVLRVSSGAHYLQRVYADRANDGGERFSSTTAPADTYISQPYAALFSVRSPGGPRSLFGERGIVPGTERGERFYLWPMGVLSPGAMRERGRHATAFLGRRHFDDADLLDRIFYLRGPVSGK